MTKIGSTSCDESIVRTMVELARAAKSHRVIVAGDNSAGALLELYDCGYLRVATTKTCRIPCGQFDIALVVWRQHSLTTLEATLGWLVHYLNSTASVVAWVGPHERAPHRRLGPALQRLGFRIESGTSCQDGVAIAARRFDAMSIAKAA
jgi:hypothetical protein